MGIPVNRGNKVRCKLPVFNQQKWENRNVRNMARVTFKSLNPLMQVSHLWGNMYVYVYTHIYPYTTSMSIQELLSKIDILPKLLVSVCLLCSSAKQGKGNAHGKEWVYSSFRGHLYSRKSVDVCSQPRVGIESNILNIESSLSGLVIPTQKPCHYIWAPIFSQIRFVESESRISSLGFYYGFQVNIGALWMA